MKRILFPIILVFTYSLSGQTQLITNGGFTQSSGWITTGDFVYNTNNTQYNLDPGYAYTSNVNNSFGNLQQGITIPANATSVTLSLYHKISASETTSTTAFDICDIEILSSSSSSSTLLTTLSNLDASSSYVSLSLSIPSTYFGQTVSLLFTADNDGGNPTRFRIDNVSVLATLSTGGTVDITTWNNTVDSTSIFPGNITNVACDHGYQSGSLSSSTSLAVGYYLSSDQLLDAGDVFLDDDQTSLSSSDSYDPENEDVLIPSNTAPGNYHILFVADKDDDVSENNETNNVVAVPITVKSTAAPLGSLTVTISPSGAVSAGAQWQLNNGGIWLGSGMTVSGLSPGAHTVSFKSISNYSTPANQIVQVTSGTTIQVTGIYNSNVNVPSVSIISPNGSQCYASGSTINIAANINGTITGKQIDYSIDGVNWIPIQSWNTTNTNLSYQWTIPYFPNLTYFQIKVTAFSVAGNSTAYSYISSIASPVQLYSLNPNKAHIFWPFEIGTTSWDNQDNWTLLTEVIKTHVGWDSLAQDWGIPGPRLLWRRPFLVNLTCDRSFYSPISGKVISVKDSFSWDCDTSPGSSYGNHIAIQATDTNYIFLIAHLNDVFVSKGDIVPAGMLLGETGSTGNSTGPHAHCALFKNVYQEVFLQNHNGMVNLFTILNSGLNAQPSTNQELIITRDTYACDFSFDASTNVGGLNLGDKTLSPKLEFHPNPSSGVIEVKSDLTINALIIYDLFGQRVFVDNPQISRKRYDLSHLQKGSYIVSVQTASGIESKILVLK